MLESENFPSGQSVTHLQVPESANVKGFFKHSLTHLRVVFSAKLLLGQNSTHYREILSAHLSKGQNDTHIFKLRSAK